MESSYQQSGSQRPAQKLVNVGERERQASMVGGAALAVSGLTRLSRGRVLPGLLMLAAGGMFFYRGKSGHCGVYQAAGINTATGEETGVLLEKVLTINKPPQQVYEYWRNLENLPRFMQHLESVQVTGQDTSRWKAVGPGGVTVEWEAQMTQDVPGQLIAWRSLAEAQIPNEGSVRFREAPGNRGTEVMVSISYHPPGGAAGTVAAKMLHFVNAQQLEQDLKRLKQIMETGEIAEALAI